VEFLCDCGVVLPRSAASCMREMWGQIAFHDVIAGNWGFGEMANVPRCCSILLYGPPGTGKTLTAVHLCRALGRPEKVVSYGELISPLVGKTESNIERIFAEARKERAVLIIDEADAVFTRRTTVRSSIDRCVNAETNTILMELERFDGVVVLTSNHPGNFDPALERRIRYKIHVGLPEAKQRAEIWRKHVPAKAPIARDVDFDRLGREYKLTGGAIANAAMAAAAAAASRIPTLGEDVLIMTFDLEEAAARELAGYGGDAQERPEWASDR
jgi:SpoVK/Ycf46/Vps4 family AAA+-type ATPase